MKYATYHGRQRAKERLDLSDSKTDKRLGRVLRYGKRQDRFSHSQQKKYLLSKENHSRAFVYEDHCYIFDSHTDRCITTYKLPGWFHRGTHYDGKERVRNVRRYNRFNPEPSSAY